MSTVTTLERAHAPTHDDRPTIRRRLTSKRVVVSALAVLAVLAAVFATIRVVDAPPLPQVLTSTNAGPQPSQAPVAPAGPTVLTGTNPHTGGTLPASPGPARITGTNPQTDTSSSTDLPPVIPHL